ncbi:hypothetical protein [Arthrobacter sp. NPDC092385]|uniref:hypothetical protein n=1 Tax=Arthrobacter sp. NPDC092385 TaxID=3363943 RepID=UPI003806C6DF
MNSRISPEEPFPADLGRLRDQDVEVLNSKVHREIDHEFTTTGEIDAETAFRKDELADELDDRDAGPRLSLVPQQDDSGDDTEEAPAGNDDAGESGLHAGGHGQARS